jgi:hypothetical protein
MMSTLASGSSIAVEWYSRLMALAAISLKRAPAGA